MTLEQVGRKLAKTLGDNSPHILTGLAVAGVVSTAVLTARAAHEGALIINKEETRGQFLERKSFKERFLLTWDLYIPPVLVGGVTIACVICANSISTKRNTALMAAYSLSEYSFKEFREKAAEVVGKNKVDKIHDEVQQDRVTATEGSEVVILSTGNVLCFDALTGRYFESNVEALRKAQNDINLQCINSMYASQNDFYRKIGLPPVEIGEELGWTTDNEMEIQFTSVLTPDNKPCLALNYYSQPIRNFHKVW